MSNFNLTFKKFISPNPDKAHLVCSKAVSSYIIKQFIKLPHFSNSIKDSRGHVLWRADLEKSWSPEAVQNKREFMTWLENLLDFGVQDVEEYLKETGMIKSSDEVVLICEDDIAYVISTVLKRVDGSV